MRISLRIKTCLMFAVLALILGGVALTVSSGITNNLVTRSYYRRAEDLAATVAVILDGDQVERLRDEVMDIYRVTEPKVGSEQWGTKAFEDYLRNFSHFEECEEFASLHAQLRHIQDANSVDCIYLVYVDPETVSGIYLVDAAEEDPCPPGCFDPIYEVNYDSLTNPERGYPAYTTDTEPYGALVTAAAPVHNNGGAVVAYAAVDIVMSDLETAQRYFVGMAGISLLVLAILVSVAGSFLADIAVVRPIRKISEAAVRFCRADTDNMRHAFSSLKIRTGDEIEDLVDSMKQMEGDLNDHVSSLLATKQELLSTREEANRMNEIANMDALTGVRNKRAYELEIKRLEKRVDQGQYEYGFVVVDLNDLKKINDHYGHEMGDLAIRKLCSIVCKIYLHSPVFRYGGDEFVVLLERGDYEKADELLKEFDHEIVCCGLDMNLKPWERISAAAGMARYDRERDRNPLEVFRRADSRMYERKREMKADKNV